MQIRRTANAGVLLTLDDVQILLDGVCQEVKPYLATPPAERNKLSSHWPDGVFFTHTHADHFDGDFAGDYNRATARPVYAPAQAAQLCADAIVTDACIPVGNVCVKAVATRHMGHYGSTTEHRSYVVAGSKVLWFLGDASPSEWKRFADCARPDVIAVPYPYVSTPSAIKLLEAQLPCKIVLLHLPEKEDDPQNIWQAIAPGVAQLRQNILLPRMGETLNL